MLCAFRCVFTACFVLAAGPAQLLVSRLLNGVWLPAADLVKVQFHCLSVPDEDKEKQYWNSNTVPE